MNTNYQNAKIYKIVDNTTDMVYIGSTCKTLEQRLRQHEKNFKGFKLGKTNNVTSFRILENNNYTIELVESYPCNTKQELNLEEGKIIKQFRNEKINIVNRNVAGRTDVEYYQDNKTEISEYKKQYYQNNKTEIYENKKQYYQNNKNLINENAKQKHNCACGGKFSNCHKSRHEKTKKHQNYINNSKTLINNGTLNITININNPEDLNKLDFLNIVK